MALIKLNHFNLGHSKSYVETSLICDLWGAVPELYPQG